jgi:hypothetical protein
MKKWISRAAGLALFGATSLSHAQQSTPLPDAATIVVPQVDCIQPPTSAGLGANDAEDQKFRKRVTDYAKCIKAYSDNIGAHAKAYGDVAQKYLDAGNKVIHDYNDYMAEVKKNADAAE